MGAGPVLNELTLTEIEARRNELRERYLLPPGERPSTPGRGIHHAALICSDVEKTIEFYQGLMGFPLVEWLENRDYKGSSLFFFTLGNQPLLGFFDFPGLGLEPGVEAIGTIQHIAISVEPARHAALRGRLDEAGISYGGPEQGIEEALYFPHPGRSQIGVFRRE